MHLVINQSTDRTEQVTTACIDKLYNLSKSNTLDGTSYLRGSINAASAYEDTVTFLNTMWGPDLIVTASAYYIRFTDSEVVNALISAGVMQEGGGLTTTQAEQVSGSLDTSRITSFDELIYFKYWNENGIPSFSNRTLLESIDLTKLERVGAYQFRGCSNLKWFHGKNNEPYVLNLVNFKSFASTAAYNMFTGCVNLKHILSFGNYITYFPNNTFGDCTALEDVVMPVTCVTLGAENFKNCSSLTTVNISHVTTIGANAFNGCSSLEYCDGPNSTQGELNLPNLTGTLGDGTFKGCAKLTSVESLGSITSIGNSTFENCVNLATINFPSTITSVGVNAFNNTAWYNNQSNGAIIIGNKILYKVKGSVGSTYTIPNNVVNITEGAFESISDIEEIVVPNRITFIPKYCFKNCSNLTTVTLPNTITGMSTDVFYNDSNLTTVNIPTGITAIGARTFLGCSSLQTLTLPNNITNLGGANIFSNCRGLQWIKIEYTGGVVPLGNVNSFEGTTCEIQVPSNLVNDYKSATNWSTYASRIQAIPNS